MVGFVNPIDAAPMAGYVSSDDFALAQAIADHLHAHLGGRGRVLVVTGPEPSYTSQERLRGFRAAAVRAPGVSWAGQIAGDYARDVARERTARWLAAHGPSTPAWWPTTSPSACSTRWMVPASTFCVWA